MEGVIVVIKITICAAIIRGANAVIKDVFLTIAGTFEVKATVSLEKLTMQDIKYM